MANYPDAIYDPRIKENDPSVEYAPEETTKIFAEDVKKLDDEVVAIQEELGIKPRVWKKIEEKIADADSTIDFVTGISNSYDEYVVVIHNLKFSDNHSKIQVQFSKDGGGNWITTKYMWGYSKYWGGGGTFAGNRNVSEIEVGFDISNDAKAQYNGEITCHGFGINGIYKRVLFKGGWIAPDDNIVGCYGVGSLEDETNPINGIRIKTSGGNFTTGKFTVYGIKN